MECVTNLPSNQLDDIKIRIAAIEKYTSDKNQNLVSLAIVSLIPLVTFFIALIILPAVPINNYLTEHTIKKMLDKLSDSDKKTIAVWRKQFTIPWKGLWSEKEKIRTKTDELTGSWREKNLSLHQARKSVFCTFL